MPETIVDQSERLAELLKFEFERDVQVKMDAMGDKPFFAAELSDEDKQKKIELAWNDAEYWGKLIETYGYRNALKASDEMVAFVGRK